MVFSRIAEVLSAATNRIFASQSSTAPYISSGLSTEASSTHRFGFPNNMRLSSSLQDFSTYRHLDAEEGAGLGYDRYNKQPNLLQRENAGSSFSKEKALPGGTPFFRRRWVRVLMVLLSLVLFAFLVYVVSMYIYSIWYQGGSKYYVVLDCGSTGTRVFVYEASKNRIQDSSLPILMKPLTEGLSRKSGLQSGRAYDRMETEPGFDKLVHNISGLKAAIKPLLQWAVKQIPERAHKSTSLFLYATAGVRRLPESDSKWLLDNAWSILKRNSPFLCQRDWVKTISGTEEAYYGWTALNYRTGMLGAIPKKETFGALDLGGSSLQVTFENKEHADNVTNLDLKIGTANHHLSAYSLSGYGLNDAFDKSVVKMLKRTPNVTDADLANGKVEIKHPCLHSGYKEQYVCSHCASNQAESETPSVGRRRLVKGVKSGTPVQLTGAPNWEECSALAKTVVNLSEWLNISSPVDCDMQPCALPDDLPRPFGQFYAISGFFVVYRFFKLTSEASLDDVLEKGREFCEKTWEVARVSVPPQPFIEQYCFRSPYIVLLLREGLHITDKNIIVGSGSVTWTLGVALLEAGKTFSSRLGFYSYEILPVKINPIILIGVSLISFILLVCALSCVKWTPKIFRWSYLPLFRHNSTSTTSVLNIPSPFRYKRWSPINSGDGRVKMPLSPTVATSQQRQYGLGHGLGGSSIELVESPLCPSTSTVSHSFSSSNLGQMQFDNSSMASFWSPHRSQMRLQSRRSQSREDLNSSVADAHLVKL